VDRLGPGAGGGRRTGADRLQAGGGGGSKEWLPLLSARPAFPAAKHHRPLADTRFTVPRRVEG